MTPRRQLTPGQKMMVLKRQDFICACMCTEKITDIRDVHFDHALALHLGGTNDLENFRALKVKHHMAKSGRETAARAKVKRIQETDGLRRKKLSERDKVMAKALALEG